MSCQCPEGESSPYHSVDDFPTDKKVISHRARIAVAISLSPGICLQCTEQYERTGPTLREVTPAAKGGVT